MKTCWIHIGMPKTGTTSVQVYLAALKSQPGWRYLSMGKTADMNREMHAMFGTAPHKWYWYAKRNESPEQIAEKGVILRQRFAEAILDCRQENIVVSSEALSLIEKPGIVALHDLLAPLCDRIRIIAYVRPPLGFMTSFFQQRLKNGDTGFDITGTQPLYRERFEKFDEIFGRENVILRKFAPSTFPNKCFVADFCQHIGMPAPGEIARVNEGLTREACGMLYAYRKHGSGYGVGTEVIQENNHLIAPMFRMHGSKFTVSEALAAPGIDQDDLAWMEQRLGESLRDEASSSDTAISSETDLLTIQRDSCLEYIARFQEIHEIQIPADRIPAGDPIDPQAVAEFMEYCRSLIRDLIDARRKPAKPVTGRTCWIHVGMHQTDAASIQSSLAKVEDPSGWNILTLDGNPNLSQPLYAMFSPNAHELPYFAKQGMSAEQVAELGATFREKLAEAIRNCGEGEVILSGESLTLIDKDGIKELRKFIAPCFDQIRIIAYVRPPASFKVLFFQQQLKNGASRFNIEFIQPKYRKRFKKFDEVFGRKNVVFRKYEPDSPDARDIVTDFCDQIGIKAPVEPSTPTATKLSHDASCMLYAFWKFGPGYNDDENAAAENRRVFAPLLAMQGEGLRIAESMATGKLDAHDLAWMERRIGSSLDEPNSGEGTEITEESDLLRIPGAACAEMAQRFGEIYGSPVPADKIPTGSHTDPQSVAQFVDDCRHLSRRLVAERQMARRQKKAEQAAQEAKAKSGPLKAILRWSRKALNGSQASVRTPRPTEKKTSTDSPSKPSTPAK